MAQGAPMPWWYNLMTNYDLGTYGGFNQGVGSPGMGDTSGVIEGQQTTPIYSVTGTAPMPNDAWSWAWTPPVGAQGQGQAMAPGAQPYLGGNPPTPPKAEAAMPVPASNLIPEDQIMPPWQAPPEEDPNYKDPMAPADLPPWWTDSSQIPPGGQPPFGVPLGAILAGAGAGAGAGIAAGMGGGNGPTAPPAQPGVSQDLTPAPEAAQDPAPPPDPSAYPPGYVPDFSTTGWLAPDPPFQQQGVLWNDWSPPPAVAPAPAPAPTPAPTPVGGGPVLAPQFPTNPPADGTLPVGGGAAGGGGTTTPTKPATPASPLPGLVGAALAGSGAPGPGLFAPVVGDPNGKVSVFQPMPMQHQAQSLGEILSQYLGGQYGQR